MAQRVVFNLFEFGAARFQFEDVQLADAHRLTTQKKMVETGYLYTYI